MAAKVCRDSVILETCLCHDPPRRTFGTPLKVAHQRWGGRRFCDLSPITSVQWVER